MKKQKGNELPDNVTTWLVEPMPKDVRNRVYRTARGEDVVHVAVMPDVHLANDYCVGTAVATQSQIMPHAVGGDIGCGMAAIRVCAEADRLANRKTAERLLRVLRQIVPTNKHPKITVSQLPTSLRALSLSDPKLNKLAERDGRYQLGTLGRGNHFLEFQKDEEQSLWLMVHSGSRSMGQRIAAHHLRHATKGDALPYLEADSAHGRHYLHDVAWAREYARWNRRTMLQRTSEMLEALWSVHVDEASLIESDHNHVQMEDFEAGRFWVHRKGAQSANANEQGVIPGSMSTASYHVVGKGCDAALNSSSHGAGRKMSRSEARSSVSERTLRREMKSVFFDERKSAAFRDEAPSAYKNIRKVIRAQRELVKVGRCLTPLVSYKGT